MADSGAPVVVLATIVAQPGKEDAVREALLTLVGHTRTEEANIAYDLVQNAEAPTEFITVERWTTAAALPAHMAMPYVAAAIASVGPFLAAPPKIVTYNEISTPK